LVRGQKTPKAITA